MTNKRFTVLFFALLLVFSGLGALVVNAISDLGDADGGERGILFYAHGSGVAVDGYDVVAYFEVNRALMGSEAYVANFGGMPWYFSSAENLAKFEADPLAYIPQFGGHCAYGTAQGYLVYGDPEAWSIIDGALYLNYNKNVRAAWLADTPRFIPQARVNWPSLNIPPPAAQ